MSKNVTQSDIDTGTGDQNTAIRGLLGEAVGLPVVGTVWAIGMAKDGVYFVSERWDDGSGGWTSRHGSLTECLDDLSERIDTDDHSDVETINSMSSYVSAGDGTIMVTTSMVRVKDKPENSDAL